MHANNSEAASRGIYSTVRWSSRGHVGQEEGQNRTASVVVDSTEEQQHGKSVVELEGKAETAHRSQAPTSHPFPPENSP